jgi:metallo-beta-lactamase class B
MKLIRVAIALSFTIVGAAAASPLEDNFKRMNEPMDPFHVIGPIYDVGMKGLDVFIIRTQHGYILIDGGLPESAPLIEANIRKLGFRIKDVRYIINEHAHIDHAGGIAQLSKDSGAVVVANAADVHDLAAGQVDYGPSAGMHFPPVYPDWRIGDHDQLAFDSVTLSAHATPGHTKGCTSWVMSFWDNFRPYTAIFTCSITVAGNPIAGSAAYPNMARDYRRTFATLRGIHADVVLAPHPEAWNRDEKLARVGNGPNPFVDPTELRRLVDASEKDFDDQLAKQKADAK